MTKSTTKIFPFAESLPYSLKNNIIVPKLNSDRWHYLFKDRIVTLSLKGGFIENLFSLSYFEVFNTIYSRPQLEWCGNSLFKKLNEFQGLAKQTNRISSNILSDYPAPAFFNKDKTVAFINCLNNYINVSTYFGEFKYNSIKPILKQIFSNVMVEWDKKYIPQFRRLEIPEKLDKLFKLNKFDIKKKFVLIFPDITGWSDHSDICLNWGIGELRSFSFMLSKTDYNLVIVSNWPQKYNGLRGIAVPLNVENVTYLIKESSFVLSKETDFVLAGLFIGNTTPCSLKLYNECCLIRNKKFIDKEKKIITSNNLTPMTIYEEIWKK